MTDPSGSSSVAAAETASREPGTEIEIQDLSVRYDEGDQTVLALDRINLTVRRNEFVCVMGPSGCGKTTLLYVIAGIVRPSSGSVLVEGEPVDRPGPDRAVVFQEDAVFPWMTVEQNIGYSLRMRGRPKEEIRAVVDRHVELVGLQEFRRAWPRQLSGGMKKRVDLARGYAANPKVLLMDEPFGALDIETKERLQEELHSLWLVAPRTIVFITHDLEEALFLGDRVILLSPRPPRADCGNLCSRPGSEERHVDQGQRALRLSQHGASREAEVLQCRRGRRRVVSEVEKRGRRAGRGKPAAAVKSGVSSRSGRAGFWRTGGYLSLVAIALWFGIWFAITEDGFALMRPIMFPSPAKVIEAVGRISHLLAEDVAMTMIRVLVGFTLGTLLSASGWAFRWPTNRKVVPLLQPAGRGASARCRVIAMIPFFLMWFGITEPGKLLLITLGVFAIVVVSTLEAVRATCRRSSLRAGETLGASKYQLFRTIIIPAVIPRADRAASRGGCALLHARRRRASSWVRNPASGFRIMEARRRLFNPDVILVWAWS